MFVNVKLTKARNATLLLVVLFAAMLMFATPTFAFSETYGTEAAEEVSDDILFPCAGPVEVTLVRNGTEYDYTYFAVECSDFLTYAGVTLTEVDRVSVPGDVILYDNMMIDVSTVEYEQYTVEEPMPYNYDLTEVDTVPRGSLNVLTEGVDGVKRVTYLEKRVGGEITDREVIAEEIVVPPVNGTAEYGVGGVVTASDGTYYTYSYRKLMEATAYTYVPGKTTMTTATGATLAKGIVAVDPTVIPMHTKMYIASDTYEYGYGVAEDTGGVIKGDIVDLAFMSYDECIQFGRRKVWVYILD